jgi:hypothetical protein
MDGFEWVEYLSYIVTIIGFPFAIIAFIYEKRRELQNEDEELHQSLADDYTNFLRLVIENADLRLMRKRGAEQQLNDEQTERKIAIFGILISLFERAYIMVYEENMPKQTRRLWLSWEDYMREWCRRPDFREALPELLEGEDPDFKQYITKKMKEEELIVPQRRT